MNEIIMPRQVYARMAHGSMKLLTEEESQQRRSETARAGRGNKSTAQELISVANEVSKASHRYQYDAVVKELSLSKPDGGVLKVPAAIWWEEKSARIALINEGGLPLILSVRGGGSNYVVLAEGAAALSKARDAFAMIKSGKTLGAITASERAQLEDELDEEPRGNPHMPRHPRPRGPRGGTSEPQSILLPEDEFTAAQAKAWVKRHGFKVGGYEAPSDRHGGRGAYHRFRQFDPDRRHSYRTISFGKQGVMAVLEVPKRK